MPRSEENPPTYTARSYYAFVLNGLSGVIDDAEASECDLEGIELLRMAHQIFSEEFERRHSGA